MAERHVWIPMADGVRLAASLYLPDTRDPCPVLLEALPYRKDDVTAGYRAEYRRLAGEHGYAVARVDLRGTGSSEGVATDEYPPQEQADLCRVIEWLAAQPWSTGAVGMYGTSYSGFNSLQVAAERPPALKAVVAIYASDDRYTDDVHYVGGALRLLDLVDYPLYMVALNALPPVPALAGPGWRERWRERVEGLEPWLLRWLQEQVDGPYWRHGSLRPAYERIACPTMLVAGWADGYRNATFRVLERLRAPSRLLLGPWSHMATDSSLPGPRIDLVPEMVRWWDRWLRGRRNGVDTQAPVTVFVRHATRPAPDLAEVAGVWRDEPAWPPERAAELEHAADGGDLAVEIHQAADGGAVDVPDRRQIDDDLPLTVTVPHMTRFLMTLDIAVDTVFSALSWAAPAEGLVLIGRRDLRERRAGLDRVADPRGVVLRHGRVPHRSTVRAGAVPHPHLAVEDVRRSDRRHRRRDGRRRAPAIRPRPAGLARCDPRPARGPRRASGRPGRVDAQASRRSQGERPPHPRPRRHPRPR